MTDNCETALSSTQHAFTNNCNGIDDCISVKRVGEALQFYAQNVDNSNNKEDDLSSSNCLLLEEYLCEKYKNLMNDYGHIIYKHLSMKNNEDQYKQIHEYLVKEYGIKCDINKCSKYGRNCRNIQRQRIKIIGDQNNDEQNENNYSRHAAYIDMLDTIHCNLSHSYDMGFRINQTELDIVNNNDNNQHKSNDSDDDDLNVKIDEYMVKMNDAVISKRRLLKRESFDRIKNNKFMTVFGDKSDKKAKEQNETPVIDDMFKHLGLDESIDNSILKQLQIYLNEQEYDTDCIYDEIDGVEDDKCNLFINLKCSDNDAKINCISNIRSFIINKQNEKVEEDKPSNYSFGIEFYYWPKYSNEESFVVPKYSNFKEELYEHTQSQVFDDCYTKIETLYSENSHFIKEKMQSKNNYAGYYYGIKPDLAVSMQHLLALKLYTDTTILSAEFSRSFRKLNENETIADAKKRNEAFAHWSKLLRELVEVYGEDAFYSSNQCGNTYFHGTSYMLFSEFSARFCAPTSTTKQMAVALSFISENKGIVLELNCGAYVDSMMFNVSFVSGFGNEDERLFFCGRRQWRFATIRLCEIDGWKNYASFVNALTVYHAVLQGIWTGNVNKKNRRCIKLLVNHTTKLKKNSISKISSYIKDSFIAFCNKITKININFTYFPFNDKYYKQFFISDYSEKDEKEKRSLNFCNILNVKTKLWPNLQNISFCEWDHNKDPVLIDIDSKYLLSLYSEICSVENYETILNGMEINIPYTNINFNDTEYSTLQQVFSPYQLEVFAYSDFDGNFISIKC